MKNRWTLRLISVINLLLIIAVNNAQTPHTTVLEEVMEDISVNNESVEEVNWENELEELSERIQQPIDLNSAKKEELEQFPFLSDIQIENLLAYVYIHGPMQTLYELQLVEEMDQKTRQYLLPFVCVKPVNNQLIPRLKNIITYSKQEILTRFDIPFYTRKGYEKTYLGPAVYNSLKYTFRYRDNLYVGLTGEKDLGEPFAALHNKQGYDYYSYYLFIRKIGWLKALALGNYRLSFGQGLVLNSDFLMGKNSYSSSFDFRSKGISKHASTDEYNYFRGIAFTVDLNKQIALSAFYSHRSFDGVIQNNEITSIYKTGLHRSEKEVDKMRAFTTQLAGGNMTYRHRHLKIGLTGIYYYFNHPYEPDLKSYSKYDLHGNKFYNAGLDYAYRWHRLSVLGEVAIGKSGLATLNKIQYSPAENYHFTLVHRYYTHNYWAMFSHSFSEGGKVQNENGWYLATDFSPWANWRFFASIDLFSFPWWKYRISKSSQGMDGLFQVTYSPQNNWDMDLRYRFKQKERDVTDTKGTVVLPTYQHRLRYRFNYSVSETWAFRTLFDFNHFHSLKSIASKGYQITQMVLCQFSHFPLKGSFQCSYFSTDDYDSRVYIPEKGLLYTYYTPSFQGKGIRFSINLRYDITSRWMIIGKMGQTLYQDRDEIGSGNDLIRSNKKADLQMQLRFKF